MKILSANKISVLSAVSARQNHSPIFSQNFVYRYDKFGNLAARKDYINKVEETFTYYRTDNSQSFNRYAYCFYNPLKYTDPSGELMVHGGAFIDREAERYVLEERQRLYILGQTTMDDNLMWESRFAMSLFTWGDPEPANGGGNEGSSGGSGKNSGKTAVNGGVGKYESPINDNYGNQNGECVYRCLVEFSESYDINGGSFEYWCNLASQVLGRETVDENGKVIGVHPNEVKKLVDNSDYFSCEEIFREDIDSMTNAFSGEENSRLMIAISGHAAMIQSITIDKNGSYTMRFAETSQARIIGCYSYNLSRDYPGCRIFKISLKP